MLPWDDAVKPALEQLDSASILDDAADDARGLFKLLSDLCAGSGPVARRLLLSYVKPLLVPAIAQLHVRCRAVGPKGAHDGSSTQAARRLPPTRARSQLAAAVARHGGLAVAVESQRLHPAPLEWVDVEAALAKMEPADLFEEGLRDVMSAAGPVASKVVPESIRHLLRVPALPVPDAAAAVNASTSTVSGSLLDASHGQGKDEQATSAAALAFLNGLLAKDAKSAGPATRRLLVGHARNLLVVQMRQAKEPSHRMTPAQVQAVLESNEYNSVTKLRDLIETITLRLPDATRACVDRVRAAHHAEGADWAEARRVLRRTTATLLPPTSGMEWAHVEELLEHLKGRELVDASALAEAARSTEPFDFLDEHVRKALGLLVAATAADAKAGEATAAAADADLLHCALGVTMGLLFWRLRQANTLGLNNDWAWAVRPALEAAMHTPSAALEVLDHLVSSGAAGGVARGTSASFASAAGGAIAAAARERLRSTPVECLGLPTKLASMLGPSAGCVCLRVQLLAFKQSLMRNGPLASGRRVPWSGLPWESVRHVLEASGCLMAHLVHGTLVEAVTALDEGSILDDLRRELVGASSLLWERCDTSVASPSRRRPPGIALPASEAADELDCPALAKLLREKDAAGAPALIVLTPAELGSVLDEHAPICIDHVIDGSHSTLIDESVHFRPALALVDEPPTEAMRRLLAARAMVASTAPRRRLDGAIAALAELRGVTADDVKPALEALGSLQALRAAIEEPSTALEAMLQASGDSLAARKLVVAQARPRVSPKALSERDLEWDDLATALGECQIGIRIRP